MSRRARPTVEDVPEEEEEDQKGEEVLFTDDDVESTDTDSLDGLIGYSVSYRTLGDETTAIYRPRYVSSPSAFGTFHTPRTSPSSPLPTVRGPPAIPSRQPSSLSTSRSGRTWVSSSAQTAIYRSAAIQVSGTDFIISPQPSPPSARDLGQAFQSMSLGDREDHAENIIPAAESAAPNPESEPVPTHLAVHPAATTTAHRRPLSFSTTPYLDEHTATPRTQPTQHTTQPSNSPPIPRLRRQGARSISSLVQPISADSGIPPRQSCQGDFSQPLSSQYGRPSPTGTKTYSGPSKSSDINGPPPTRVPHTAPPPPPPSSTPTKHDPTDVPFVAPPTSTLNATSLKKRPARSSLPTPPQAGPSQPSSSARTDPPHHVPTATRPVRAEPPVRRPVPVVPVVQSSFNGPLDPFITGRREWFVVAWGWMPGLYHTWDEAKIAVNGCKMAIFQSFVDPYHARVLWEDIYYEGDFCRMRVGQPYPDRRVNERVADVHEDDYWYLQSRVSPTSGYTVVFRGLYPGVYSSWLLAGTLVVGVRGALFRGYRDFATAKEAFSHAEADGVVVTLTLVVPLDMRFLQM